VDLEFESGGSDVGPLCSRAGKPSESETQDVKAGLLAPTVRIIAARRNLRVRCD
jgi:hypothetical protein